MRPTSSSPLPTASRLSSGRGSALITVIVVVLILTVVGLGVAFFSSTEDRISGNAKLSRAGFYAAEAGLRQAEALVTNFTTTLSNSPTVLLSGTGSDLYSPPGGGRTAYLLKIGGVTYRNVVLAQTLGDDRTRDRKSVV